VLLATGLAFLALLLLLFLHDEPRRVKDRLVVVVQKLPLDKPKACLVCLVLIAHVLLIPLGRDLVPVLFAHSSF
jgi:hypothetical protein